MSVCAFVSVFVCECVLVCVREREFVYVCVFARVYVCVTWCLLVDCECACLSV